MEDWFKQYSQKEREYLKKVIRKIYQLKKAEIDKIQYKDRVMFLANMFAKNIIHPTFYKDDSETLKDVFLYSEWIINHWVTVSSLVQKENTSLLYRDEETMQKIHDLKTKISKVKGKTVQTDKLSEKYRLMMENGKTPEKIRIEKLDAKNIDGALKYLEEIEKAV